MKRLQRYYGEIGVGIRYIKIDMSFPGRKLCLSDDVQALEAENEKLRAVIAQAVELMHNREHGVIGQSEFWNAMEDVLSVEETE